MKRLPLLLLLFVLLAGLGFVVWWSTREATPASGPAPESGLALQEPPQEPVQLEGTGASSRPASEERASAAPAAPAELAGPKLRARVQIPAGIEEPGTLQVFALSRQARYSELIRLLERERRVALDAGEKPEGEGEDEVQGGVRIVARAVAAPDGGFELALPAGARRAHLCLQGRFLYLRETRAFDPARKREIVLLPEVGACLRGRLTLPAEAAVPPAKELALSLAPGGQSLGAQRSGELTSQRQRPEELRFEFRGIAVGDWTLTCEPESFAYTDEEVPALRAGELRELELKLEQGGRLRGLVRQPDGKPATGAEVRASRSGQWFGFDDRQARKATAGEDGRFELVHVASGQLKLRASAPGFVESERLPLELASGAEHEGLVLDLREGAELSGTVRWPDESPAAGATIELAFDLSQMVGMGAFNALEGSSGKATADAEGAFAIRGLGKGPFTLRASSLPQGVTIADKKQREAALHRGRLDGVTPGSKGLVLVLRAGQGLAGRVVDDQGEPVKKFLVKAQREGQGLLGGLGQDSQVQEVDEAQGRFVLGGLAEGNWKLWVSAESFAVVEVPKLAVPRAADAPELVVALQRTATVRGRVLGADGGPVVNARIEIENGTADWQRAVSGAPEHTYAHSESDASFELLDVAPGRLQLVAAHPQHARGLPVDLELAPGQVLEDVVLRLRSGGRITGEIFGEGGKPASGVFVQATLQPSFDNRLAYADGQGRFELEHLVPGSWQIVAMPALGRGQQASSDQAAMLSGMKTALVEVREGEESHVVLGAPPEDPVHVHGQVTHAGAPYVGAMISFVGEGKDVLGKMKNASVAKDGQYEVTLDAPGHYVVSVQKLGAGIAQQNLVEFSREIPEVKEHPLSFEMPTGRISGRVLDPEGKPAGGARVSLHPPGAGAVGTMWGGQYVEDATDGEGRYDLQALRPGKYVLMAGGMSFMGMFGGDEAPHGREILADLHLAEGEWKKEVDFRLKKAGRVDLLVVDEAGQPVKEAAVFARDATGNLLDRFSMLQTDMSGRTHYSGLAPGEYSFSTRADVRASAEGARVKLAEGETKEVKLVLQGATLLLVRCEDRDGKPVKVALSVLDEQGREVGSMISLAEVMKMFSEGGIDFSEQRIGPLPPGKYRVHANMDDGRKASKPVTLSGQPERKLTLRLE